MTPWVKPKPLLIDFKLLEWQICGYSDSFVTNLIVISSICRRNSLSERIRALPIWFKLPNRQWQAFSGYHEDTEKNSICRHMQSKHRIVIRWAFPDDIWVLFGLFGAVIDEVLVKYHLHSHLWYILEIRQKFHSHMKSGGYGIGTGWAFRDDIWGVWCCFWRTSAEIPFAIAINHIYHKDRAEMQCKCKWAWNRHRMDRSSWYLGHAY